MKSFFWKIFFCLAPIALAAVIVGMAFWEYYNGTGGFKLGVDLVGGTILIYEVDVDKFPDGKLPEDFDAQLLANRLKTRIDPNDLYNVTVRAASKTRFEIILPTGGLHQISAEEQVWSRLLDKIEQEYPVRRYVVPTGDKIQLLADIAAQVDTEKHPVGDISKFINDNYKETKLFGFVVPTAQQRAWKELLAKAAKEYPPKRYVVGRGRTDLLLDQIFSQYPHPSNKDITDEQIAKLSSKELDKLEKADIEERNKITVEVTKGETAAKSLTTEKIQEVKELLTQVGSLEFRILASQQHDRDAWDAAKLAYAKPRNPLDFREELDRRARGNKPPPPLQSLSSETKFTATGRDGPLGKFGYSWIEMSKTFRAEHGLANPRDRNKQLIENPTKEDADRGWDPRSQQNPSRHWWEAKMARDAGQLFELVDRGVTFLVYSRRVESPSVKEKEPQKKYEFFVLARDFEDPTKRITGDNLAGARPGPTGLEIHFTFKPEGATLFHDFTSANIGQQMAIILDGMIESSANIESAISSSGRITGNFTRERVDQSVRVLRAGALPGTLKKEPVSESTMGPTLGADTIRAGTFSVLLAFGAVLIFMLVYYRFAGFVACVALLANLLLTIAFMVLIQATFTLPGLAGLVLMLGMAVDANVLIYERLREERDRGASLALALRNGYERALPTIIDTHLTSIFTAIVLWMVGNDQLKGFGISLTVGLIISLYTSLYLTWVMFEFWRQKGWLHKLTMMEMFKTPKIPFMKIRYYWFAATAILTVLGAALFIGRLDHGVLNIDFTGGTAETVELKKPESLAEVRKALEGVKLDDLTVEQIFISTKGYTDGSKSKLVTVRTSEKSVRKVADAIAAKLGSGGMDWLKTVNLKNYHIDPSGREVEFEFVDPDTKQPAFASRAQVGIVLTTLMRNLSEDLTLLSKYLPDGSLVTMLRDDKFMHNQAQDSLRKLNWDTEDGRIALAGLFDQLDRELKTTEFQTTAAKLEDRDERLALADRLEKLSKDRWQPLVARWEKVAPKFEAAAQQLTLTGLGAESEGRSQWMKLTLIEPMTGEMGEYLQQILKQAEEKFKVPQPERLENFDSQLAADTQTRALIAILASWGAILLFLWFRCGSWTFGLAAVLCLIHDLFFTLGIIAASTYIWNTPIGWALDLRDFKIDLPAVAALLTLVGYSVSDTIVVFDRIREVRGKNPALTPQMIDDSVNQTLSRTLLTAASVALVVLVLFIFGGEGVHLFAFVMVVGVIVGTYSSIYIASPLLLLFGEGGQHAAPTSRTPVPAPATAPTE
jgi:SecD/SecF fusion protein